MSTYEELREEADERDRDMPLEIDSEDKVTEVIESEDDLTDEEKTELEMYYLEPTQNYYYDFA
jgi:hypothetical protein